MRRWIIPIAVSLTLVASAGVESQPWSPLAVDRAIIRVNAGGNELRLLRDAPVAFSSWSRSSPASRSPPCRTRRP